MRVEQLSLTDFRNFSGLSLSFHPAFNLIYGENGSGKTSILESIYLLSHGRSFRAPNISSLIRDNSDKFVVFCALSDDENHHRVGIEKKKQAKTVAKINQNAAVSLVELTNLLPVLLINHQAHDLIDKGPQQRRKFIDWGVFHVEPNFYTNWKQYIHALKQRNAALKNDAEPKSVEPWTQQLISYSLELDSFRSQYLDAIMGLFVEYIGVLMPELFKNISFTYYSGWSQDKSLANCLEQSFVRDKVLGYTQIGAHRADIRINFKQKPVEYTLSRGQQKLLACALKLAQAVYFRQCTGRSPVVLIDDFTAELDNEKQDGLKRLLLESQAQIILTATSLDGLFCFNRLEEKQTFHVEQGKVKPN